MGKKRISLAVLRQLRKYERHLEREWSYDLDREAWQVGDDLEQLRRLLERHGLRAKVPAQHKGDPHG